MFPRLQPQPRLVAVFVVHIDILHESYSTIKTRRRRASGAEKRQSNPHDRQKTQTHPQVKNRLRCDHPEKAKANVCAEIIAGLRRDIKAAAKQRQNQPQNKRTADEP